MRSCAARWFTSKNPPRTATRMKLPWICRQGAPVNSGMPAPLSTRGAPSGNNGTTTAPRSRAGARAGFVGGCRKGGKAGKSGGVSGIGGRGREGRARLRGSREALFPGGGLGGRGGELELGRPQRAAQRAAQRLRQGPGD